MDVVLKHWIPNPPGDTLSQGTHYAASQVQVTLTTPAMFADLLRVLEFGNADLGSGDGYVTVERLAD